MDRNFWLYSMGRLVSFVGTGVQDVALPLFILDLTGSGTLMGTFMIASMVPRLILYPVAGVIGDRLNRKWIMVWTDLGRGALILFLALLATRGVLTIPILFLAQLLISVMNALFGPATMAMIPDIVEDEELTKANSTLGGIDGLSMIVGPAMGGIIYGLGGIQTAFLVNGASFVASGISEIFIKYTQLTTELGTIRQVLGDLKEGLSFVKNTRALFVLIMFALAINAVASPLFMVHVPYVLRVVIGFSPRDFGIIQASFMAGLLIGNIILGTLYAKRRIEDLLNRGLLVLAVMIFVLAALIFPQTLGVLGYASMVTLVALTAAFVFAGVFNAFVNTPINVGLQRLAPAEFRARVFSVVGVGTQAVVPIGFGVMGFALDLFPSHLIALGVAIMSGVIIMVFVLRYSRVVSQGLSAAEHLDQEGE
jgi:MFS family permease